MPPRRTLPYRSYAWASLGRFLKHALFWTACVAGIVLAMLVLITLAIPGGIADF